MQRCSFVGLIAALTSVSCSDAAPPVAEVRAHYTIGGSCPTQPSYGGIGATEPLTEGGPIGVPDLPPTNDGFPTGEGGPIVDGQPGPVEDGPAYKVSCSIKGQDDLRLDLRLSGQNTSPWVTDNVETRITAVATIKADGTGTGTVSFFTRDTQNVSGSDCTFRVAPGRDGNPRMAPGELFATFTCPGVTMNSTIQPSCEARGTLVLARCEKD